VTAIASRFSSVFRQLSIQRKLLAIVLATTFVALGLAVGLLSAFDYYSFQARMSRDLVRLAESTALISEASVVFDDATEAASILETLRAQPHVASATIWKDGELFARYGDSTETLEELRPDGPYSDNYFLTVFHTIRRDGKVLGVLQVQSDWGELRDRVRALILTGVATLLITLLVTALLTSRLQRFITGPILRLANVTNSVRKNRDYSIRATKESGDELAQLVEGFNEMLTEIQLRDEEVTSARKDAEQANQRKSHFLANMSHELRTPLNAVIGYAELLTEDAAKEGRDQVVTDLARIHSGGTHLLALINDVLDLSKIEAGKLELTLETFNILPLLDDVVSVFLPLLARNQNEFTVRTGEDLGTICADARHVRQVLFNLLSNAAKFTENGKVDLNAEHVDDGGRSLLRIRVTDTGIGMTEKEVGNLFQAFTQAGPSTARKYGGTGLGLALSRELARHMGGDITVVSEQGVGSRFTLDLPLRTAAVSRGETTFNI
jgi:signal transduction histidine kinase